MDAWFLMSSPLPVLSILVVYLYFVIKLGPQLMRNRQAFELKRILVVYNLYQVLFSVWLCCRAFLVKDGMEYIFTTSCADPHTNHPIKRVVRYFLFVFINYFTAFGIYLCLF